MNHYIKLLRACYESVATWKSPPKTLLQAFRDFLSFLDGQGQVAATTLTNEVTWPSLEGDFKVYHSDLRDRLWEFFSSKVAVTPTRKKCLFVGGGAASGKSSIIEAFIVKESREGLLQLDVDALRIYHPGYLLCIFKRDTRDVPASVHSDCSSWVDMFFQRAIDSGQSFVFDGTMTISSSALLIDVTQLVKECLVI